ncbi:MAG: dimethylsulfonioproprionate lyase family protein [Boseongicola sp.]|nr:dimethylsulfonioproprionate lyase family protein [Boseongicola sp.]MDD9976384.1 dimethylsulfonioproprionate lyase family protein [Boseongicola sp.]
MTRQVWDNALIAARNAHASNSAAVEFCDFPNDIRAQTVDPFDIPAASLMASDANLKASIYPELRDAFIAAGPVAHWRETYKETDIGADFMDRFACYCLIGSGGAFDSQQAWAWLVYMPPNLYYPHHHHPGEEIYLVVAGQAEFYSDGDDPAILSSGAVRQHKSNQPHAMQTFDDPVMAMVMWRNGFETPPVWTEERPLP